LWNYSWKMKKKIAKNHCGIQKHTCVYIYSINSIIKHLSWSVKSEMSYLEQLWVKKFSSKKQCKTVGLMAWHNRNVKLELSHLKCHVYTSKLRCHIWYISNISLEMSHLKCHIWNVTSYMSHLICHIWYVTFEMSHLKCQISNVSLIKTYMWKII